MNTEKVFHQLTEPQKSIWYMEKTYPGTSMNIIAGTLRLKTRVDFQVLEEAINIFIKENDALRLHLVEDGVEPKQYVTAFKRQRFEFVDFSAGNSLEDMFAWDALQSKIPFQITESDLFCFKLVKVSADDGGFFVRMHHLIADAWTMSLLGEQIVRNYEQLIAGRTPTDQRPSYLELIDEERKYAESARYQTDKAYWEKKFEAPPEQLALNSVTPMDVRTMAARKTLITPAKLSNKIRQFCKENNQSVFALFMAGLSMYIFRVLGKDDVVVGTTILNRLSRHEKETVGMYASIGAPARIHVNETMDFDVLVSQITKESLAVLRHQRYPYYQLLRDIKKKQTISDNLFSVVLSYQNTKFRKGQTEIDYGTRWHFPGNQVEPLAININDREDNGNLILDFDYRCDIFNAKEIEFIHKHMISLLWHALDNPKKQISQLEMLSSVEKNLILNEFNQTDAEFPDQKTLHQFLEAQAEKTPEHIAVISEDKKLSYREVNEKANQLARQLRSKGVLPDTVVGISLERSEKMIIGLFAILKAGGAYLPIDHDFPDERKAYMLNNSGAGLLLCAHDQPPAGFAGVVINVADETLYSGDASNLTAASGPRHLAYVIYTSGSTGRPKGVMIEHRSIVNRINWMQKAYPLDERSVILQKTRFTFDVSVWELFWWSFTGASVCMLKPGGEKEPDVIVEAIDKNKVTTMHFVPSMLSAFLDYVEKWQCVKKLASLKHVFSSGEALAKTHADAFNTLVYRANKTALINLYGPTEAAVDVSYFNCSPAVSLKSVPIGKPIDNIKLYILDKYMSLVPVGVPGELFIGGVGVGRGYINNPALTQERFVQNPFAPDTVIYKTGDRARWYPRGDIEYLGRIDFQVKIRGIRIELGEIENALHQMTQVRDAVLKGVTYNSHTYLCAYIVRDGEIGASDVRDYLSKKVPDYMIPAYIIFVDSLPRLSNGKTDRNALPDPDFTQVFHQDFAAPRTETEEKLVRLWCQVLRLEKVGIDDNFFNIGGDSLSAISLIVQIHKAFQVELSVRDVFALKTIRQLAGHLERTDGSRFKPIARLEDRDFYPVSSAQKRLFILHQLQPEDLSYNLPAIIEMDKSITLDSIIAALQELVSRHEALRTSFTLNEGQPVQIIHSTVNFCVEAEKVTPDGIDGAMRRFIRPYDLACAPLMRACLVDVADGRRLLYFDMHHIISDGASLNILAKEFNGLLAGSPLPPLAVQYRDYAQWHNDMIASGAFKKQEEYWLSRFSDDLPVLNLPTDRSRPLLKSAGGRKLKFTIGKEITAGLRKITAETGATLYMILLAAYNVLLHKYTGQEDIIVGIPVEGRMNADVTDVVGVFVNMLAIRNSPSADRTFLAFLQEVKEQLLEAYENQDYPFELLVDKAKIKRDMSRNPIFDTSFVLQQFDLSSVKLRPYSGLSAKFDLSLEAFDLGETIDVLAEYATALFDESTIERLVGHFLNLLRDVVLSPWKKLEEFNLLSNEERDLLLGAFSGTDADYPRDKTLQEIFETQAAVTLDNTAVVFGSRTLTYRQLNEKANQLARLLRKKGVGPDQIVGIALYRSEYIVIGLLAILKAGGAYLPIDPGYPEDRIRYMLEDSGARLLITEADLVDKWQLDIERIDIRDDVHYRGDADDLSRVNTPSDLAYIIYTSGSTGKPKGVMIEHRNVVRLLFNSRFDFSFSAKDTWTMFHSFCFDFSVWEMYGALLYGGKLVVVSKEEAMDTKAFLHILKKEGVTVLNQTPGAFYNLIDEELKAPDCALGLRYVIFGGEALKPIMLKPFKEKYPETRLINMYGITETTVHVTYKEIDNTMIEKNISNIGRPIPTLRTYIVDKNLALQPIGIPGELCVSGDGVGRGYLNNAEFTNKKFVASPFGGHGKLYRSEDLARMLPTGEMEYLGRIDNQVKIRGFRIELGEVEYAMLQHPEIREAVVAAFETESGGKKLFAYYLSDREIPGAALRAYLHESLPDYMIPSFFTKLNEMPLTINGKIDKRKLPKRIEVPGDKERQYPKNDIEDVLLKIWCSVLHLDNISTDDDFFDLGGDSLTAIKMLSLLPESISKVTLVVFYNNPTIQQLAEKIGETVEDDKSILLRLSPQTCTATVDIVCFPYGGGNAVAFRDLSRVVADISDCFAVYAINQPGHDLTDEVMLDIEEAAGRVVSDITEKCPNELILYSHCVGSALLFETARRLTLDGRKIRKIVIGGVLPPQLAGVLGKFFDPWMFYSKKRILAYLEKIGLEKSALENRYADTVIRAFRHDARCFYRYFYTMSKEKKVSIDKPVDFVFGEKDRVTRGYKKVYGKWCRYVREARLHVIEDASHYFLNTHPEKLAEIIIE